MSTTLDLENEAVSSIAQAGVIHQAGNPPANKTFRAPGEPAAAKSGEDLLKEFGVDADNLSQRRAFLRLAADEAAIIKDLIPWAKANAEKIAKELYDWQFEFAGTARFLERFAKRICLSKEALRERLEAEQTSYILSLFEGALSEWGLEYFESRLRIGAANSKIDMPMKWQTGAFAELQLLLRRHLSAAISNGRKLNEVCGILARVINLDIQAIQDAFTMKLLEALSVKIDEIVPDANADRTEHLDQAKQALSALVAQAEALAGDRLHDPVLQLTIPAAGKMGETILQLQDFLTQMAEQAEVLASGDLKNPRLDPLRPGGGFKVLSGSMGRLLRAQNQIASIATAVAAGNMEEVIETHSSANILATAVNSMVGNVRRLVEELSQMAEAHARGQIDAVIEAEKFEGAFRVVAQRVNEMVGEHIAINRTAIECVSDFGRGNFEAPFAPQPGQRAFLNEAIEGIRTNLKGLVSDMEQLTQAVTQRNLRVRLDASRHSGDYRTIMSGMNQTIDAVIEPLRATSDNANTLAQSAEVLTTTSRVMATEAESTANRANAVSTYSQEVSNRVTSVAASSEEMLTSIREISQNAHRAAEVVKSAVTVVDTTNRTIGQLGESSREIGQVIKVITSIAQQTNLLALNATIEAARAGAAGQGFAVVATEVKELAKATANATEEISHKIEAIQSDTKSAVKAIAEVSAIITQINDISNSIASAVEQQTATTNEIGRHVQEAARNTDEITRGILAVAESARETARGASETQTSAQDLTDLAARMQKFVRNFEF